MKPDVMALIAGLFALQLFVAEPLQAQPLQPTQRPLFRQSTDYSCGLAALAMTLTAHGSQRVDEALLLARFEALGFDGEWLARRGTSLAQLKSLANSLGFAAQGVRLTLDQLTRLPMPLLVYLQTPDGGHFSVLEDIELSAHTPSAQLADPSLGRQRVAIGLFKRWWSAEQGMGIAMPVWTRSDVR